MGSDRICIVLRDGMTQHRYSPVNDDSVVLRHRRLMERMGNDAQGSWRGIWGWRLGERVFF